MRHILFLMVMSFSTSAFSSTSMEQEFSWAGAIPSSVSSTLSQNLSVDTKKMNNEADLKKFFAKNTELTIINQKYKKTNFYMIKSWQSL